MKLMCPECNNKDVRHLKKKNVYWCRKCGNEWPRRKGKK